MPQNTVQKVSEILNLALKGEMTFEAALKLIAEIDITDAKTEGQTLTVEVPFLFFAASGAENKHLTLAEMGGTECLIEKRAIDEFSKARLLWKLKLKEIEVNQIKEMIGAYEGALDRYGHFEDKKEN